MQKFIYVLAGRNQMVFRSSVFHFLTFKIVDESKKIKAIIYILELLFTGLNTSLSSRILLIVLPQKTSSKQNCNGIPCSICGGEHCLFEIFTWFVGMLSYMFILSFIKISLCLGSRSFHANVQLICNFEIFGIVNLNCRFLSVVFFSQIIFI